jgi:hypothetical protein
LKGEARPAFKTAFKPFLLGEKMKLIGLLLACLCFNSAQALPFDANHSGFFLAYLDLNLSPASPLQKPFTVFVSLDSNRGWDENCLAVSFKNEFIPLKVEGATIFFPLQEDLNSTQGAIYRLHADCTSPFTNQAFPEPIESISNWRPFTQNSGCHYGNGQPYYGHCGSANVSQTTLSANAFLPPERWLYASSSAWLVSTSSLSLDFNSFVKIEGRCAGSFSWMPPQAVVGLTNTTSSTPNHAFFSSDCRTIGFSQDNLDFTFIQTGQEFKLGFYAIASIRNSDQHGGAESAAITHQIDRVSLFKRIEVQDSNDWQIYTPPLPLEMDDNAFQESIEPPSPSPPASAPAGGPIISPPYQPKAFFEGSIHSFPESESQAAFKFASSRSKELEAIIFSAPQAIEAKGGPTNLFQLIIPLFLAPALLLFKKKFKGKPKRMRKVPRYF